MTEKSTVSGGWVDEIWDFFSSMKLGLALLAVVAFFAAVGTIFKGQDPSTVSRFWQALGITDVYSTAWFRLLMGLLCINLVICSIQRFQGIYNKTFRPVVPLSMAAVPNKARQEIKGDSNQLRAALETNLRGRRFRIVTEETESGWGFVALKHRWGNWGSFLTHLAFVILVIGSLISGMFGFSGVIEGWEGQTTSLQQAQVQHGKITDNYNIKVNSFTPKFLPDGERDNWYTDLSILQGSKEVARQTISVNHPLTYHGLTFYQSSWGIGLSININGTDYPLEMSEGDSSGPMQLPGSDLALALMAGQNLRTPSISYVLYKGSQQVGQGTVQSGQTVDLQNAGKLKVTGWISIMQVKKDPGVPVVWLGCAMLLAGLLLSFYWRPVTLSGVMEKEQGTRGTLIMGTVTGRISQPGMKELEGLAHSMGAGSN